MQIFCKVVFCHLFFFNFTITGWISLAEPTSVSQLANAKLVSCFFADDLVMLESSKSSLKEVLNDFAVACNFAGIKINLFKSFNL